MSELANSGRKLKRGDIIVATGAYAQIYKSHLILYTGKPYSGREERGREEDRVDDA